MSKRKVNRIVAIREFFGLLPGQTTAEFFQELKALSDEEKQELAEAICALMGWEPVAGSTSTQ